MSLNVLRIIIPVEINLLFSINVTRSSAREGARHPKVKDFSHAAVIGVVVRKASRGTAHATALTTPHHTADSSVGGLNADDAVAAC